MANRNAKSFDMFPASMDDLDSVSKLLNAHSMKWRGAAEWDVKRLAVAWRMPGFDFARDVVLVRALDGRPVGLATAVDLPPHTRLLSQGFVHPDYRDQGVGSILVEWLKRRGLLAVPHAPNEASVALVQSVPTEDESAQSLLERSGFERVRYSWRMFVEFDVPPAKGGLPETIVIRPFISGREERPMIAAVSEAFRDHWGWVERPFEEEYDQYMHYLDHDPDNDPALWFVAVDGDEIAGTCFGYAEMPEDPELGFVFALGVRKPWRRRGLGLTHTFGALYERGKHKIALDVDAQNPTGATRLYEKAGMHIEGQTVTYELVLREATRAAVHTTGE